MSSPISGIILIGLSMIIVVKSFTTIKQNKTKMLEKWTCKKVGMGS